MKQQMPAALVARTWERIGNVCRRGIGGRCHLLAEGGHHLTTQTQLATFLYGPFSNGNQQLYSLPTGAPSLSICVQTVVCRL